MTKGGVIVLAMSLITILFLTLKLCGIFEGPWMWVFSPVWIPLGEVVLGSLIAILIRSFDEPPKKGDKE